MLLATIKISKTNAKVTEVSPITAGLVGATVQVEFDSTWDGYSKVYVWSGCDRTITDTDASGVVPAEVVEHTKSELKFGVYGIKNGKATPTIWANLGYIRPGAEPNGDEGADPSLPIWAQLKEQIDNLKGADPEAIQKIVDEYLKDYPSGPGGGVDFKTGETLKLENGILSVNTTNDMERDNTLPITSAGVFATVGNIEALLETI